MPLIPSEIRAEFSQLLKREGGKIMADKIGVGRTSLYDAVASGRASHQVLYRITSMVESKYTGYKSPQTQLK